MSSIQTQVRQRYDRISSRLASRLRLNCATTTAIPSVPSYSKRREPDYHLILYDYEASPWCRLVREYATILDLQVHIRPCPRETLWGEGVYTTQSTYRSEAAMHCQKNKQRQSSNSDDDNTNNNLTFPILVDMKTTIIGDQKPPIVISQSYDILCYLWDNYGGCDNRVHDNDGNETIGKKHRHRRPDQIINSSSLPFVVRFLSLAGPSYLRPWPWCGLMRYPTNTIWKNTVGRGGEEDGDDEKEEKIILYQIEGCYESRLVREALCSLEIPYLSIPMAVGTCHTLPSSITNSVMSSRIPLLIDKKNTACRNSSRDHDTSSYYCGAEECVEYLWRTYSDPTKPYPTWWTRVPGKDNIGHSGSFSVGVYTAFLRGSRSFVPEKALQG